MAADSFTVTPASDRRKAPNCCKAESRNDGRLSISHLSKRYRREKLDREVVALSDIDLPVEDGEFIAIVEPKGC